MDKAKRQVHLATVFICPLLNNTVRRSDYIPPNYRVINEGITGKGRKGSGRSLF
jgi:hypothetical protein